MGGCAQARQLTETLVPNSGFAISRSVFEYAV